MNERYVAVPRVLWERILNGEIIDPFELAAAELDDIAAALNSQAGVAEALEDCIDSLEYVDRAHPEVSGWGVRIERIAKARRALAAVKGVDRDH